MNQQEIKVMKRIVISLLVMCAFPLSYSWADPVHTRIKAPDDSPEGKQEQIRINRKIEEAKAELLKSGPKFGLVGVVERGRKTRYSVNGEDFDISPSAVIQGDLRVGSTADVSGDILENGALKRATTIVVATPARSSEDMPFSESDRAR